MASFYVIRGRDNGQHFAIRGASASIGREAINQIQLRDSEVSRRHARIIRTAESNFEIVDNGSSNGTFVNGRRVQSHVLKSGDRVQVGRTLMIFTGGPDLNSTRSIEAVEIVTPGSADSLSQIRSSMESQLATASSQTDPDQIPADSLLPSTTGEDKSPALKTSSSAGGGLEIFYQVGQAIHRTVDLADLLTQVLDLIFRWIDCDRGCILMNDDITGQLTPITSLDRRQSEGGRARASKTLTISRTILDHVCKTKEGVLTSNAQNDDRWASAESVTRLGVHEAICVPMLGRYGLVGAIYIDTSISPGEYAARGAKSSFNDEHLMLMMTIAGQAALAIEDTQFYRAMVQSERLAVMGQTIANLSHHVKNILQGVSGGNYLVDEGLKNGDLEIVRKGWEIVQRNQDRISNLVMDMLSYSKHREPNLVSGDLRLLIDDIVQLVKSRPAAAGAEIVWQRPSSPLMANFDSDAIHRALLNVVSNAIDAVAGIDGGRVLIEAEVTDETAQIRVMDNGPGIAEEDAQRIFAPFESTKGSAGTGLGLPVSQKILREHGGDISLFSRPGEETCFLLHWPNDLQLESPPTRLA